MLGAAEKGQIFEVFGNRPDGLTGVCVGTAHPFLELKQAGVCAAS